MSARDACVEHTAALFFALARQQRDDAYQGIAEAPRIDRIEEQAARADFRLLDAESRRAWLKVADRLVARIEKRWTT